MLEYLIAIPFIAVVGFTIGFAYIKIEDKVIAKKEAKLASKKKEVQE